MTPADVRPSRGAFTLSATELLACWEALRLGKPPTLLRIRRPGATPAARAAIERHLRTALARLTTDGLADRTGPTDRLAGMLRTIAHARCLLDIR